MRDSSAPTPAFDIARFELMLGAPAAHRRPESYHLMALSDGGGLDIMVPWSGMLAAAPSILRHEDAFGWASISRSAQAVHCALLECLMRECCARAGAAFPSCAPVALAGWGEGRGELAAFALLAPPPHLDGGSVAAALAAIARFAPEAAPDSSVHAIPGQMSHALSMALLSTPGEKRDRVLASAGEALELNRESAPGRSAPRASRI